jgi:hypothetical protein
MPAYLSLLFCVYMVERRCLDVQARQTAIPKVERLFPGRVVGDLVSVGLERGANLPRRQVRPLNRTPDNKRSEFTFANQIANQQSNGYLSRCQIRNLNRRQRTNFVIQSQVAIQHTSVRVLATFLYVRYGL